MTCRLIASHSNAAVVLIEIILGPPEGKQSHPLENVVMDMSQYLPGSLTWSQGAESVKKAQAG